MVLKAAREKVEKTWTITKKLFALLMFWGLIFSIVTVSRLGVAFTYDDGLVQSKPAFQKAGSSVQLIRSSEYWNIVNNAYDLESPRILPYTLSMIFRVFGFKIRILAERGAAGSDALKKEWRHIAPKGFVFVPEVGDYHLHLQDGRFILFFGSSDRQIEEAKKAGVFAIRIKRGREFVGVGEYHPGHYGEPVMMFSEY